MNILISFMPWILFGVISTHNYLYAVIAAFVSTIIICIPNFRKKNLKILDIGTFGYFVILFLIAIIPNLVQLEHWTHSLSSTVLFLISFISIIIGKPFTIQYAKETVEEQYWQTPGFIRTNYIISSAWALGFALTAASSFMSWHWLEYKIFFSTYIPAAITVVLITFTKRYPEYVRAKKIQQNEEEARHKAQNI